MSISIHPRTPRQVALASVLALITLLPRPAGAIPTLAAITLTNSVNSSSFKRGERPVYTIVVRNTGDMALSGGALSETLPLGLTTPVSVSASLETGVTGTLGLPPLLLSNLSLAPGRAATITLTATVDSGAVIGSQITSTATVSLPQLAGPASSQAVITVLAGSAGTHPAMIVTKSVSGSVFRPGERPVYTIAVRNTGDVNLSGGVISDTLSSVFTLPVNVSIAYTSGATGTIGTLPTLLATVAMPIGSALTLTLTPTIATGAAAGATGATITNTVAISMSQLTAPVSATAVFTIGLARDKFDYLPLVVRE